MRERLAQPLPLRERLAEALLERIQDCGTYDNSLCELRNGWYDVGIPAKEPQEPTTLHRTPAAGNIETQQTTSALQLVNEIVEFQRSAPGTRTHLLATQLTARRTEQGANSADTRAKLRRFINFG